MDYNPNAKKTYFNLPPGEYPAEIVKAEEKTSTKGNPMLVVEVKAFEVSTGRSRIIRDYIVVGGQYSQEWKIRNLCESCGIGNSGSLDPAQLQGLACKVRVKVKPAEGKYEESNTVADYLECDQAATKAQIPAEANDPIPF